MIWLSGQLGTVLDAEHRYDLGVMCQPTSTAIDGQLVAIRRTGIYWAVDNEAFSEKFDADRWRSWLARVPIATRLTCLFVVVPDVLHKTPEGVRGDPEATYARFWEYITTVRDLRYRAAYVTQDGATTGLVPWEEIDCLFVGGSDAWKLCDQSVALIREAQERGLWTHMGRCQARETVGGRIAAAHALGMDSGDGTVLARDPSRLGRVVLGLHALNAQIPLEAV